MKYIIRGHWFRIARTRIVTKTVKSRFGGGDKTIEFEEHYHLTQAELDNEINSYLEDIEKAGWELISMAKQENWDYYNFLFRRVKT